MLLGVLSKNAVLDKQGKVYVNVLKVPHHGSDRIVSMKLFDTVYVDYYVISSNGRDGNPSLDTLKWFIESGYQNINPKNIVLTNKTPNVLRVLNRKKSRF
jgi:beta-lactamase superfamily II metal-dependent hydrolase